MWSGFLQLLTEFRSLELFLWWPCNWRSAEVEWRSVGSVLVLWAFQFEIHRLAGEGSVTLARWALAAAPFLFLSLPHSPTAYSDCRNGINSSIRIGCKIRPHTHTHTRTQHDHFIDTNRINICWTRTTSIVHTIQLLLNEMIFFFHSVGYIEVPALLRRVCVVAFKMCKRKREKEKKQKKQKKKKNNKNYVLKRWPFFSFRMQLFNWYLLSVPINDLEVRLNWSHCTQKHFSLLVFM